MSEFILDATFLSEEDPLPPTVDIDHYLSNGDMVKWEGETQDVFTPLYRQGSSDRIRIGSYPLHGPKEATEMVEHAAKAYNKGMGAWPQMTTIDRIRCVEKFLDGLRRARDEIVNLIMWEICKNASAAAKEVDRTIDYIVDTLVALKKLENDESTFHEVDGKVAQIRRAPYGVVLCAGPFNYPLNETYTTLIPALLMGNTCVLKLPKLGCLLHAPTFELFRQCFPAGVINICCGSGRATMPSIMQTGLVDILAFIGTSKAASALQKAHPQTHRLRVVLGLEAKNPGIVMPDADIDLAVTQCVLGSLSYNGQRCTALKLLMVHEDVADEFTAKFADAVDALTLGLPWKGATITHLAESFKPKVLSDLVEDAVSKGARVVNKNIGSDRSAVRPTVLAGVTSDMSVYHEEQFGPLVPIVTFKDVKEVYAHCGASDYGQQASIFSRDPKTIGAMVDVLVNQVSRVNINAQCQRGPDVFPFTGRRNSAYGTLSVFDALRAFSIRSLVATSRDSADLVSAVVENKTSKFLRLDHLF